MGNKRIERKLRQSRPRARATFIDELAATAVARRPRERRIRYGLAVGITGSLACLLALSLGLSSIPGRATAPVQNAERVVHAVAVSDPSDRSGRSDVAASGSTNTLSAGEAHAATAATGKSGGSAAATAPAPGSGLTVSPPSARFLAALTVYWNPAGSGSKVSVCHWTGSGWEVTNSPNSPTNAQSLWDAHVGHASDRGLYFQDGNLKPSECNEAP